MRLLQLVVVSLSLFLSNAYALFPQELKTERITRYVNFINNTHLSSDGAYKIPARLVCNITSSAMVMVTYYAAINSGVSVNLGPVHPGESKRYSVFTAVAPHNTGKAVKMRCSAFSFPRLFAVGKISFDAEKGSAVDLCLLQDGVKKVLYPHPSQSTSIVKEGSYSLVRC